MKKAAGTGSHQRKAFSAPGYSTAVSFAMSDGVWERLRAHITDELGPAVEEKLRADINRCCEVFLSRCRELRDGAVTAEALRSPGKRQPSSLEKLTKGLRMAADAWVEMGGNPAGDYASRTAGKLIDDHIGPLSDLGSQLEALARDAERRLKALSELGEPDTVTARPELVRAVKQSLRNVGLAPSATGRVYASSDESGKPTWFQKFMGELNDSALGIDGWGPAGSYSLAAFYTEVAKALR